MGRRTAITLALCTLLPLLLLAALASVQSSATARDRAAQRLSNMSYGYSVALTARLAIAETLVQALSAQDAGDGAALRQHAINSGAFKSAVLIERSTLTGSLGSGGETTPLQLSLSQLAALDAGETVLLAASFPGRLPAIFLSRSVLAQGKPRLVYFELAPDWIWRDAQNPLGDVAIAVVDSEGRLLESLTGVPHDVTAMFARHIDAQGGRLERSRPLAWQAERTAWTGSLTQVPLTNERITTQAPWAVVVFQQQPSALAGATLLWRGLPLVVLLALAAAGVGALYLTLQHLPPLKMLQAGMAALAERNCEPLGARGSDEPSQLVDVFNRCAVSLQEQLRALETLGEIDRLLLGSAGLEQVLDAILSRVQAVTRCQSVGIALRDGDAPGRGRVYLATVGLNDLPVSRVALDDDMLTTLAGESGGLTITRCEELRHSFLRPLKDAGSEFFWVWPVVVDERVEAILAVGYREPPATSALLARSGGEFAARLAAALSKSARDEQLYRQAHYDPLTALPNRLLFRDRLSQELASAAAGTARGALLYIDLDHFKRVNDSVGHSAGDQLLTVVAQRLRAAVKEGDTVARLGGDEFTVILRNVSDEASAHTIAERIVESLQLPVSIAGRDHRICASIGITMFPQDGAGIEELVRNADTAMYRAKDLGRGRAMFFEPSMTAAVLQPTESGLHRALRRREFSLFYQPQFAVTDGGLAGVEALLRWQTPRDGLRGPAEFVPAAEESGLIVDIGGWVLDAACAQLAAWRDRGMAPPRLALNIALQQLREPEFPKSVRRALEKYGLPSELLELELTESALVDETAGAALARLAQTGVRLALDNFGSGYDSLGLLREYPIGIVKIDRRFLAEVPHNPASSTLVETVIVMAHALGRRVVAEGIETIEQLDFLRERRCDIAQGFYLARPLAAAAMTELLNARIALSRDATDVRATG